MSKLTPPRPPSTRRVQMEFAVADVRSGRNFEFAGEAAIIARCPAPPIPLLPPWTARRLDSSSPGQLDMGSLPVALNEWCANPAEVTYGHISTWDVRAVTDMQGLFTYSSLSCYHTFNVDINGWDVGQVTTMEARRCPASQSQNSCAHSCSGWWTQAECMCWHGAEYVPHGDLFQPALGCMGRRPGHRHAGVPLPCVRIRGSCTHTAAQGSGHKPCACAGAAQSMFHTATSFNQPLAAWDVDQVTGMRVRRRPCELGTLAWLSA